MTSDALLDHAGTDAHLTVREVAIESGVTSSAVRFYEKHGVIRAVRTAGNQRRFDDSAACRILVAKLAQRVGLTVREIAELFEQLPVDRHPDARDWDRIGAKLVNEAEHRVTRLKSQLAGLKSDTTLCEMGAHTDG
ncbi:MerR family transcriptional regulator [Rhodococcus sp. NPDC058505]|uniref:MerR family transcriptional regulator n=1 Tax=unclassified Rhodococcus (in: high G+C Gram-positive bacteria) TaxID=192944 RepID=UPI003653106E